MKSSYFLLIILFLFFSCTEDEKTPTFSKDYGNGLYIATSNGVSFYKDGLVKDQIFKEVNGITLSNVNKIKFKSSKAYIATNNRLYSTNVETFENKGEAGLFKQIVDFDFVSMDRIFVVDKEDSKVKVVDIDRMEITSDIETADSTMPVFITSRWYRSIVLNGGVDEDKDEDGTIVVIDHKDEHVPLADIYGSLYIGENPNSAVWIDNLKILCQGVYDPNDLANNTTATLVKIDPWEDSGLEIDWDQDLNKENAKNLVSDLSGDAFYFTASDGVYTMSPTATGIDQIIPIISDVLCYQYEEYLYPLTDSTTTVLNREILYVNDPDNKNTIYKWDIELDSYIDTIIVDGDVRDISFY